MNIVEKIAYIVGQNKKQTETIDTDRAEIIKKYLDGRALRKGPGYAKSRVSARMDQNDIINRIKRNRDFSINNNLGNAVVKNTRSKEYFNEVFDKNKYTDDPKIMNNLMKGSWGKVTSLRKKRNAIEEAERLRIEKENKAALEREEKIKKRNNRMAWGAAALALSPVLAYGLMGDHDSGNGSDEEVSRLAERIQNNNNISPLMQAGIGAGAGYLGYKAFDNYRKKKPETNPYSVLR